jgi:general secretion pathway protein I
MSSQWALRARGFTLIEVLVALAIVVVGIAALLTTLSSAADTTAYLRDKTFAGWIGYNRIAEIHLALTPPGNGKSSGTLDYAGRKWRDEQDIEDLPVQGIRRIDVRVALADSPQQDPDSSWIATASSVLGSALAKPGGGLPNWDIVTPGGSSTGLGDGAGQAGPGSTPRAPIAPNPRAGAT